MSFHLNFSKTTKPPRDSPPAAEWVIVLAVAILVPFVLVDGMLTRWSLTKSGANAVLEAAVAMLGREPRSGEGRW
jgi:hypothetical protein